MSSTLKKWSVPPSYDLGIPPYFHGILKDAPLIKAYLRERLAHFDTRVEKEIYEAYALYDNPEIPLSDQPRVDQDTVFYMFEQCGLPKETLEPINEYIRHLAFNHTDPVNLLRLKEFVAYCGVEGVYDLEKKKHFKIARKTQYLPLSIVPKEWRTEPDVPRIRREIARMMDTDGEYERLSNEINLLSEKVWKPFREETINRVNNGLPVKSFDKDLKRRAKYLKDNPHLIPDHDRWAGLVKERDVFFNTLMDTYAPLHDDYVFPEVKPEFYRQWDEDADQELTQYLEYEKKYDTYWANQGKDWNDKDYVPYNHDILRQRAFTIKDWVLRDYTVNKVNRAFHAESRRHKLPRSIIDTVKAELEDGMLSICGSPHRFEPVEGKPGQYHFIVNNCISETVDIEHLREMEQGFEENAQITEKDAHGFLNTGRHNYKLSNPAYKNPVRDGSDLANVSVDIDKLMELIEADDDEGITRLVMESEAAQRAEEAKATTDVAVPKKEVSKGWTILGPAMALGALYASGLMLNKNGADNQGPGHQSAEGEHSEHSEHPDVVVIPEPTPVQINPSQPLSASDFMAMVGDDLEEDYTDEDTIFSKQSDSEPQITEEPQVIAQEDLPFPDMPLDLSEPDFFPDTDNSNKKEENTVNFGKTNKYRPREPREPQKNKSKLPGSHNKMGFGGPADEPLRAANASYGPQGQAHVADFLLSYLPFMGGRAASKAMKTVRNSFAPESAIEPSLSRVDGKDVTAKLNALLDAYSKGKGLSPKERRPVWNDIGNLAASMNDEMQALKGKSDLSKSDITRLKELRFLSELMNKTISKKEIKDYSTEDEKDLMDRISKLMEFLMKLIDGLIKGISKVFSKGNDVN